MRRVRARRHAPAWERVPAGAEGAHPPTVAPPRRQPSSLPGTGHVSSWGRRCRQTLERGNPRAESRKRHCSWPPGKSASYPLEQTEPEQAAAPRLTTAGRTGLTFVTRRGQSARCHPSPVYRTPSSLSRTWVSPWLFGSRRPARGFSLLPGIECLELLYIHGVQ